MNKSPTFDLQVSPPPSDDLAVEQPPSPAEKLLGWLDLVDRNRRTLLIFMAVGVALSAIIAFSIPSRYEAVTQLMPPDQSNLNAAMLGALTAKAGDAIGAEAGDALGLRTSGATVVEINSRTIQDDLGRVNTKQISGALPRSGRS